MRPAAQGWCPGVLRPMAAGDGWLVRVRPVLGRLSAEAALGLCAAAARHASGVVELTRRGNVQIRGVRDHAGLVRDLAALGLVDESPEAEARRNVLVEPFWRAGDDTARVALDLAARIGAVALPAKWGWVVDCGPVRRLDGAPGDVRVERGASGGLIVRADGAAAGMCVAAREAAEAALGLARWFAATGGAAAGRMARHLAATGRGAWPEGAEAPAAAEAVEPGTSGLGPVVGVPFGQVAAGALAGMIEASGAAAVRVTPWRALVLEGGEAVEAEEFVTRPGSALMAADACPGAPACAASSVETRALAWSLAGRAASLHVSGCAKGCARGAPTAMTVVGRDGRYDLVPGGRAWDEPVARGLSADEVRERVGAP